MNSAIEGAPGRRARAGACAAAAFALVVGPAGAGVKAPFAAATAPAGAAATGAPPAAAQQGTPPAAVTGRLMTPAELADQFEKCLKSLRKAEDALDGHDAGRVSLLLQRADEHVATFEAGSGLAAFANAMASARAAAGKGDFPAAEAALRRGRDILRSLSDYTVARPTEVAYRSALGALADGNRDDFEAALARLEATVRTAYLEARLREARDAIARGRAAMVKRDMKAGLKAVETARFALGRMDYASALSRARHSLIVGAELLRDGSFLTAREQAQAAQRYIRRALERVPEAHVEALDAALATTGEVLRRLSQPEPDDPGRLEAAADSIETLRQQLR